MPIMKATFVRLQTLAFRNNIIRVAATRARTPIDTE
jgi:hypothetical protein